MMISAVKRKLNQLVIYKKTVIRVIESTNVKECPYNLLCVFFQTDSFQIVSVPWQLETVHHNTEIQIKCK